MRAQLTTALLAAAIAVATSLLSTGGTRAADLYNNTNGGGVANGPRAASAFMLRAPAQITQLITYHWNGGRGAPPGTLALKASNGRVYGPFRVHATAGQNNAPNVNWIADVNFTLPAGTYQVIDSDPATWSQNAQSAYRGFAIVRGTMTAVAPQPNPSFANPPRPASAPTPAPAPASAPFKPCFVNAGSIASMGPCQGPVGTRIVIQISRQLKAPLTTLVFKPNRVTGIAGGTGAEVIVQLSGGATAPGSYYVLSAPAKFCLGGGGTWDAFPVDANGRGQGDIGRFGITGCR